MPSDGPTAPQRVTEVPISKGGRDAFVALVVIAVLVGAVSGSVPVAVAVLAVGALVLGAFLLLRARRAERG